MTEPAAVDRTIAAAEQEVRLLGHSDVGTEHLLLGLLADEFGDVATLLRRAGVTASAARHMVAEVVVAGPGVDPAASIGLTARAQRAIDRAGRFSRRALADGITDEHLLLGVLDVEGLACQVLRRLDVDPEQLRIALGGRPDEGVAPEPSDEPDESDTDAPAEPTCAQCGAPLATRLTRTTVTALDGTALVVVHCGACGAALAALHE
jgi:ATP-dependent Clp protease ATP-binding subunit ClpC